MKIYFFKEPIFSKKKKRSLIGQTVRLIQHEMAVKLWVIFETLVMFNNPPHHHLQKKRKKNTQTEDSEQNFFSQNSQNNKTACWLAFTAHPEEGFLLQTPAKKNTDEPPVEK